MLLAKAVAKAIVVTLLSYSFIIVVGLVRYLKAFFINAWLSYSAITESSMKSLMLVL